MSPTRPLICVGLYLVGALVLEQALFLVLDIREYKESKRTGEPFSPFIPFRLLKPLVRLIRKWRARA